MGADGGGPAADVAAVSLIDPGRCSMGHDHGFTVVDGYGPTPAAALRALTAALRGEKK